MMKRHGGEAFKTLVTREMVSGRLQKWLGGSAIYVGKWSSTPSCQSTWPSILSDLGLLKAKLAVTYCFLKLYIDPPTIDDDGSTLSRGCHVTFRDPISSHRWRQE